MTIVRLSRAFAYGAPLAFLVGAFVGPPDPFSQLLYVAVGFALFVPAAYVTVADATSARRLFVFYGVVLLTTVLGSVAVNALDLGQVGRVAVVGVAVLVGAVAAVRFG